MYARRVRSRDHSCAAGGRHIGTGELTMGDRIMRSSLLLMHTCQPLVSSLISLASLKPTQFFLRCLSLRFGDSLETSVHILDRVSHASWGSGESVLLKHCLTS